MSKIADFTETLSVIIAEGKGCHCPKHDTCEFAGNPWCRNLVREGDNVNFRQYDEIDIARCAYRDKPGCCWVLDSVEKLATEYLRRGQIHAAPVPSEAVTIFDQNRSIELRFVPLKAYHGIAWLLGDEWVIQVNTGESSGARRHTIFHEAFHIACRNASPAFKRSNLGEKQPFRELVADHFSTCFLMPKEWVEERWLTVQDVKSMAHIFDVSLPAMRLRLRQLGLIARQVSR